MKILHITETIVPIGGIETYLLKLLPLIEAGGHANVVIYRQGQPPSSSIHQKSFFHVPAQLSPEQARRQIANIINCEKPAIIYLHAIYDPKLVKEVTHLAPTVAYIHDFHPICPGLGKYFHIGDKICNRPFGIGCVPMIYLRRCASARHPANVFDIMHTTHIHKATYQSLQCVIVASTYMKNLLIQNGFDANRICILAPHFESPYPSTFSPQKPPCLLFVGRLEPEKGLPYLLDAMTRLENTCQLLVAGNGTYRREYEALARKRGLADQVNFVGWLDDTELHDAYRRANLLVMPAIWPEPFGKVGIEALAHGRPVVAFNVGGISDWLKDGVNGYLVESKDVQTLAVRINQLLQDEASWLAMGQMGQMMVAADYTASQHLEKLLAIFQQCAN